MMGTFSASKLNRRKMIPWDRLRQWHYDEASGFWIWKKKIEHWKIQESFLN